MVCGGEKVLIWDFLIEGEGKDGTNDGLRISDLKDQNRYPVKVLALTDVVHFDVLDNYGLLIVLSGQSLFAHISSSPFTPPLIHYLHPSLESGFTEGQVITVPLDAMDPPRA